MPKIEEECQDLQTFAESLAEVHGPGIGWIAQSAQTDGWLDKICIVDGPRGRLPQVALMGFVWASSVALAGASSYITPN